MTTAFFSGTTFFFNGLQILKHPRILPFMLVPLLLNALLYYFSVSLLYEGFSVWLDDFIAGIPTWLSFIAWLLKAVFYIVMLLVITFSFVFVANIIGSPFYGLMSEQVEKIHHSSPGSDDSLLQSLVKIVPQTILRESQKILYYLLRLIPLLVLWLLSLVIPPLAIIMPFIWFLFAAAMLAVEYIDYPYDNNQIAFKQLKTDLKQDRYASLGFGCTVTVAAMIPLFNIIAIPAAVCGGTLFYLQRSPQKSSSL